MKIPVMYNILLNNRNNVDFKKKMLSLISINKHFVYAHVFEKDIIKLIFLISY